MKCEWCDEKLTKKETPIVYELLFCSKDCFKQYVDDITSVDIQLDPDIDEMEEDENEEEDKL